MRGKSVWNMLRELVSPILLYVLLTMILTGILEMAVYPLAEPENAMWLLTLVNAFQIPVFLWIYRRQKIREAVRAGESLREKTGFWKTGGSRAAWKKSFGPGDLLLAVLGGFFLARGFNGLIGLTPLPRLFSGYQSVTESIYRAGLLSQIFASVVTAPVLEELLMRGLIYSRLRSFFSDVRPAVLAGALVFALFHGNVVQGAYAFLIGLYFVWLYEAYHSLVLPVLAHAAANASSVLLEQTGWLDGLYADLPLYFLTTALCLGAGAFCWSRARKIQ